MIFCFLEVDLRLLTFSLPLRLMDKNEYTAKGLTPNL